MRFKQHRLNHCPILTVILFIALSITAFAQDYAAPQYPLKQFGLDTATSDSARFWVMHRAHTYASLHGGSVSYDGIEQLTIEIPSNATSIPLSAYNDFSNVILHVKNTRKNFTLFTLARSSAPIEVSAETFDSGDFQSIPQIAEGVHLLQASDNNPWVAERIGYGYAVKRSDILLIVDGKAVNKPVMPYNTAASELKCYVCPTDTALKRICHLRIDRDSRATFKTYCIRVAWQNNVLIDHVTINTPDNKKLYSDGAISIGNSTNIRLEHITINGTYSQTHKYGYGISMNNVWHGVFSWVNATGKWGVFGCNNLNHMELYNCDLNRFDIHCYGRDVHMEDCTIHDQRVQYSSTYGVISYLRCQFINADPVFVRPEYNSYVPFEVVIKDCIWFSNKRKNSILSMGKLDMTINQRPELTRKAWPNVKIENLKVYAYKGARKLYVFKIDGKSKYNSSVDHVGNVEINGLQIVYPNNRTKTDLYLSTYDVEVTNALQCTFENIDAPKSRVVFNMHSNNADTFFLNSSSTLDSKQANSGRNFIAK